MHPLSVLACTVQLIALAAAGATSQAAGAEGGYSGPLFDTGAQVGSGNAAVKMVAADMKQNNVVGALMFFVVDAEPIDVPKEGIDYTKQMIRALPGKVMPFIHQAEGASEITPSSTLVAHYKRSLKLAAIGIGQDVVRGFGELDIFGWQGGRGEAPPGPNEDPGVSPSDSRLRPLVALAAKRKLKVMLHPNAGDAEAVATLLAAYPRTTFLAHQFPEQFDYDRGSWLSLMSRYKNLYFTVTADHTLFDSQSNPPIGLLYRYQDLNDGQEAARRVLADFDQSEERLLQTALNRYRASIEANPGRFMWGSEAGTGYAYEPRVYNRWINYSRRFIGSLSPDIQEQFAYKTAQQVLGRGVRLPKR